MFSIYVEKCNLKLHPDKCSFFNPEVTFLGHKCTNEGILPVDSKFEVNNNYPRPKNGDEAKRFVAFCNYYIRFLPNFAEYSRHLPIGRSLSNFVSGQQLIFLHFFAANSSLTALTYTFH